MLPHELHTERLHLRVPRADDAAEAFAAWTSDAEVTRYLSWRPHVSIDDTRAFIELVRGNWERGQGHLTANASHGLRRTDTCASAGRSPDARMQMGDPAQGPPLEALARCRFDSALDQQVSGAVGLDDECVDRGSASHRQAGMNAPPAASKAGWI